jgi:low temperature requirement protein LtrA
LTAVEDEHRVTPFELFFDLVFVFAFTQVATLLAGDPTFAGIGRGVLVLAALWWAWAAYAGLTNTVDPRSSGWNRASRCADCDVHCGSRRAGRLR